MKASELRVIAECAACNHPFGNAGVPFFWRVRVERWSVKMNAVQRRSGLDMMLGNIALADAFDPGEDLAVPVMEPVTITLCEDCAVKEHVIPALVESADAEKGGSDV